MWEQLAPKNIYHKLNKTDALSTDALFYIQCDSSFSKNEAYVDMPHFEN